MLNIIREMTIGLNEAIKDSSLFIVALQGLTNNTPTCTRETCVDMALQGLRPGCSLYEDYPEAPRITLR